MSGVVDAVSGGGVGGGGGGAAAVVSGAVVPPSASSSSAPATRYPSTSSAGTPTLHGPHGGGSLVPEIYVTPTDSDRSKILGMATRRDSTNSNLSCSLPNLAAVDDLDDVDGGEVSADGGGASGGIGGSMCGASGAVTKPKEMSIYCSPRPSRRNGDKTRHHHNGQPNYPFLKCIGKPYRERLESTDSNESDCSASHQSTCATSDYTHLTSLDMINILSMRDQYHGSALGSNMDLSDYGTLRRTHSNPENCMLTEEESKQVMESSDSSLRDSKSCTNLEASQITPPVVLHGNMLRPDNVPARPNVLPTPANAIAGNVQGACAANTGCSDTLNPSLLQAGSKSLAVSEENLHSRVNRWLGNVETNKQSEATGTTKTKKEEK